MRRGVAVAFLLLAACESDPVTQPDAGFVAQVDGGVFDSGPSLPSPFVLRLEAAPGSIEGRPWPSDHWRQDGVWNLPEPEDDDGFFHVTMRQIQKRQAGFALRPVGRVCFTKALPVAPPPADLLMLVDALGVQQTLSQLTLDRQRNCLGYAASSPLLPGATYYLLVKQVEGDWSAELAAGSTPSSDPVAQGLASAADVLAAEPFTLAPLGSLLGERMALIADESAFGGALSSAEVLAELDPQTLANGPIFGLEQGRRGYILALHIADLLADSEGALQLESVSLLNRARLNNTKGVMFRSESSAEEWQGIINPDWSVSLELSTAPLDVIHVFQQIFVAQQSFPELAGEVAAGVERVVLAQAALPNWRSSDGLLAPLSETGPPPAGNDVLPFHVYYPAGPMPEGGWPLTFIGGGYGSVRHDLWITAQALCREGSAVAFVDAAGHGGGPQTHIVLSLRDGSSTLVAAPGRSVDLNNDGFYQPTEGLHANWDGPEFAGMTGMHDGNRQTVLDLSALLSVLLASDFDGDDLADFNAAEIAYIGHSNGGRYGMSWAAHEPRLARAALLGVPGDGYIPYLSSYRPSWAELFDTWLPPLTNIESTRYGLFDEGILWPGAGLIDAPEFFQEINRYTARRAWLAGDAEGEGAAALWRLARAAGEPRAELLVQLVAGDPAVVNPDSMRLVDAAGDEAQLALIVPEATDWRLVMRYSDLFYRHLIPLYEGRVGFAPAQLARLARQQVVNYIGGEQPLDVDGDESAFVMAPDRRELRFLLGFDFWELRQLYRF
jgi:hypothetical protein